jgi:choline-sulfatase
MNPSARRRAALLVQLTIASVLCVCAATCSRTPPVSVLMISVDSLRADHLGSNGYQRATTPVLDRVAREGTSWTGALAAAPWTTPSMMSVMTGLWPDVHHVEEDDRVIDAGAQMLAERFRSAGYATAGFVPSATLTARFGFSRGFDFWDERDFGHRTVTSPAQASSVIHWLEKTKGPFFAWVHLWDPHYNYNPPSPYDTMFLDARLRAAVRPGEEPDVIALKNHRTSLGPDLVGWLLAEYDGEVAYTDRYIGEILDALKAQGRLDGTLVVIFGDHGEAFQEHGWLTHTNTVYEETIRVPLIARLPGRIAAGRRIEGPCSLVQIAGSVRGWAGLSVGGKEPAALPDESAAPSGEGPPPPGAPFFVSTTRRQATVLSARSGRWSVVGDFDACRYELYDLVADPHQTRDLALARPEILSAVRAGLHSWIMERRREHVVPLRKIEEVDPELFQKLGALGYADLFGDRMGRRSDADLLKCP